MSDAQEQPTQGDGQPRPERERSLIGRTIGHYEIISELGRGGMATVFLARQQNMSRQVAIKVLPREFLHDPQFIERFKREVNLIAELEHPHILPVYDFGEIDGIPFIVMRYLAGGSMSDWLHQGIPALSELERPIQQVCSALDFAHGEGIIHRDLKPSNIMLDERGNAYLSDFGIAQVLQDAGRLTGSGVIGTPAYMSPEQAQGMPLDARSDIYALGVVLFEMVTGREPFQADTPMAMLLKQMTEPMPSPRIFRPDLPQQVEDLILKATAKDPAGRYASAGVLTKAYSKMLVQLEAGHTPEPAPPLEATFVPGQALGDEHAAPTAAAQQGHTEKAPVQEPTVIGGQPGPAAAPAAKSGRPGGPARAAGTAAPAATQAAAAAKAGGGRGGLIAVVIAAIVLLAGGGGLLASGALSPPAEPVIVTAAVPTVTPGPSPTVAPATPFAGANTYRGPADVYQVSMPSDWTRQDRSTDEEVFVLWHADDNTAMTALRLRQTGARSATEMDRDATRIMQREYGDERYFSLLDRQEQPDGSLRVSYRVPQPDGLYAAYGPGQLDVFFWQQGPYFVIGEFFLADDSAGADDQLATLQQVLASVHIDPNATLDLAQ